MKPDQREMIREMLEREAAFCARQSRDCERLNHDDEIERDHNKDRAERLRYRAATFAAAATLFGERK